MLQNLNIQYKNNIKYKKIKGENINNMTTALDRYKKKYIKRVLVQLNRRTEPELVEWIEKQDNVQGYIKELIRQDIKRAD